MFVVSASQEDFKLVITSCGEYLLKPIRNNDLDIPGENDEDGQDGQCDPAGVRHAGDARHLGVLRVVELVDDPWGQVVLPLGDHRYVQHRVVGPGLGKDSYSQN